MGQEHYGLRKRPGSDNWYINLVIPGSGGKLHVESTRTTDLAEAKQMRDAAIESLKLRDPRNSIGNSGSMGIELFMEKVLGHYKTKKPGTYRIVRRAFSKLLEALPVKKLGDITPETLESLRAYWIKTGHIKADAAGNPIGTDNIAGANREIRALVTVMRWAEDSREIAHPVQNWRRVIKTQWREKKNRTLFYTPAQHKKLREAAGTGIALTLYMLAYHGGLRRGEIRHLRREDIDLDRRRMHIRTKHWADILTGKPCDWSPKGSNIKRDADRAVPIDGALHAYLKEWLAKIPGEWIMSEDLGMPYLEDTLSDMWQVIVENSGVKIGSMHTLRHCFATDWLSRGEPLENVQRFLGHAQITTTQDIYNHFVPTSFATAAR